MSSDYTYQAIMAEYEKVITLKADMDRLETPEGYNVRALFGYTDEGMGVAFYLPQDLCGRARKLKGWATFVLSGESLTEEYDYQESNTTRRTYAVAKAVMMGGVRINSRSRLFRHSDDAPVTPRPRGRHPSATSGVCPA